MEVIMLFWMERVAICAFVFMVIYAAVLDGDHTQGWFQWLIGPMALMIFILPFFRENHSIRLSLFPSHYWTDHKYFMLFGLLAACVLRVWEGYLDRENQ